MASVRQLTTPNREGKRPWVVEYTDPSGKRRRATPPSGLKKDADKLRQKIEREIEDGAHVAKSETVTLGDAVQAWLEEIERRHRLGDSMAGSTLHGYRGAALNHVVPEMGARLLTTIDAATIQQMIDRKADALAHKTCKRLRTVFAQSLRLAVRRGWIKRHPMVDDPIRIPGGARRKEIVVPSKAELAKLLKTMFEHKPYRKVTGEAGRSLILSLSLFTGLRRGEIAGLQWEDIDFAQRQINVRHSLSRQDGLKETKTKSGRRTIPLAPALASIFDKYAEDTGASRTGQLLRTKGGNPYQLDAIGSREWCLIMRDAEFLVDGRPKYSLHVMRHAFISLMIEQGVQPIVIKGVAGHARISTTMDTYGHLFPENAEARRGVLGVGEQFAATPLLPPPPVPEVKCESREDWIRAKDEALALIAEGVPVGEIARRFSTSRTLIYKWQRMAQRDISQVGTRQERDISV